MNKKILISLSVIVAVAAIAVGATTAYFSDTETSTGNTFTAGAIDLKVDSECTYNGVASEQCGTWGQDNGGEDITSQKFFNFTDVKPSDLGENTVSLHVINNDAWVCATVSNLSSDDNGLTEPESEVDTTDGVGNGELQNYLTTKIWRDTDCDNQLDEGVPAVPEVPGTCTTRPSDPNSTWCANEAHQNAETCLPDLDCLWTPGQPGTPAVPSEEVLASGNLVNGVLPIYDSTTNTGALTGGSTACLGIGWSLPASTGNEVQTDSLTSDISFNVVQTRNNSDFRCVLPN